MNKISSMVGMLAVATSGAVVPPQRPLTEPGRRVLVRISAAPQPERREMTDEERAQLKLDRKERRAARMRLRKQRGFR